MNTKKIITLSFSTLLFACGNETANQSENTSADTTTQKTEVETNYATALPVGNGFQLRKDSYVISELLGSTDAEYSGQLLTVILTEDNELLLQIAEAFLLTSLAQKILINFYIRFDKPLVPSKVFTNKEKAIEWLRQFAD